MKMKIIVRIWGGLGNQMFQYAFAYALSMKYDREIYLDTSFYENQPKYVGKRKFKLSYFPDVIYKEYIPTFLISFFKNKIVSEKNSISV